MPQSKEVRYTSQSITPPPNRRSRSRSLSRSRGRSHSRTQDYRDTRNPGNNLYITGLSTRVTSSDLEKYFSKEGRVQECHVVMDPRTKESRGFGFVTMANVEDADCCIKYLNHSVLEGRLITVEKAKRRCGRTPTPGKYRGARERRGRGHGHSHSYSPHRPRSRSYSPHRPRERDCSYSRGRRQKSHSPCRQGLQRRRGEQSSSPISNGNHRSD